LRVEDQSSVLGRTLAANVAASLAEEDPTVTTNAPLNLPFTGIQSFFKYPVAVDLERFDADVGILGIPLDVSTQYRPGARFGPRGIRESSSLFAIGPDGAYDPERDETYLGPPWRIVDCGDVDVITADLDNSLDNVREAARRIVAAGGMIVGVGGDHSVTIPILQALEERGPFGIIQFDAHLDFTDERGGQRNSQSSPIRRASEMDHVTKIAQLGIRGTGSSSRKDFADARAYGSVIMGPAMIREQGIEKTMDMIPDCERYYVTIDCDGIDPSIARGTGTPSPGGFTYEEMQAMLEKIANRAEIVGFDFTEVAPIYDPSELTTQISARIILDFIGFILKARERRGDLPKRAKTAALPS